MEKDKAKFVYILLLHGHKILQVLQGMIQSVSSSSFEQIHVGLRRVYYECSTIYCGYVSVR